MVTAVRILTLSFVLFLVGCIGAFGYLGARNQESPADYQWNVPEGFPVPTVPADNPMTAEKVELGRQLFFDTRLSGDGTISCSTCHQPEHAFTDGRARAIGIHDNLHPRSAMSLANVAYNVTLGWDDPGLTRLEDQILIPLFNTDPPEMGVKNRENEILSRFQIDARMKELFGLAFPGDPHPISITNIVYALASYERTLISGNSAYDRWAFGGKVDALSEAQRSGARLFFSKRLGCFRCHAGFNLSGPVHHEGDEVDEARFHNTGLYNEDGAGAYPSPNTGLLRHTGKISDMGKFRAPTLRNIALTAPYMHDGSVADLEAVIDHYAAGGRHQIRQSRNDDTIITAGTDPLLTGFELTADEKQQLISFLHALTDETFINQFSQGDTR